ncbi:MAG: hypothetical protein A3F14_06325 [Gammaproteobacteria bacterium RIFCSPHIGHO2_12_FULL_43_28]|nr:MAG: hypothetical protein A3F14_06325 [Gammaproteobacteria bacterium RIFCSPHIGHO2_12_FULL_43_28]
MNMLKSIELTNKDVYDLKAWLCQQEDIISFFHNLQQSTLIVSHTIQQEIGGINDNLARYLYEADTEKKIERVNLHSALCEYDGMIGVSVTNKNSADIRITLPGFNEFTRFIPGGFVILPALAAAYLVRENIEPVLVKRWLMQTTFSPFNPKTDLYQDQLWVLSENHALIYSERIASCQIVLQGIHDMADHAANAKISGWKKAIPIATEMCYQLTNYFHPYQQGNIPSHLISFAAGTILDELVQVSYYGSMGRITTIQALLAKLNKTEINPHAVLALKDFPVSVDHVIAVAAKIKTKQDIPSIYAAVDGYYEDILNLTYMPTTTVM